MFGYVEKWDKCVSTLNGSPDLLSLSGTFVWWVQEHRYACMVILQEISGAYTGFYQ